MVVILGFVERNCRKLNEMGFEIEREIGKSEMKLEKLGLLMKIDDLSLSVNFLDMSLSK